MAAPDRLSCSKFSCPCPIKGLRLPQDKTGTHLQNPLIGLCPSPHLRNRLTGKGGLVNDGGRVSI